MINPPPFPSEIAFAFRTRVAGDEDQLIGSLTPGERSLLTEGAADKRVADFALGRDCARAALRQLGTWVPGTLAPSILRRDRAPLWPAGLTGSLAHSHGAAVSAVARTRHLRGVGIDLERLDRDASHVTPRILRAEESVSLAGKPPEFALLVFCVKESIYKALNPLTGVYLGFQDAWVHVKIDAPDLRKVGSGTLEWELFKAAGPDFPVGYRGQAAWSASEAKSASGVTSGPWLAAGVWVN